METAKCTLLKGLVVLILCLFGITSYAVPTVSYDSGKSFFGALDGRDPSFKDADCKAVFVVKATGIGKLTYQWQSTSNPDDELSWSNIGKAVAASYTTPRLKAGNDGRFGVHYRCKVSDSTGPEYSDVVAPEKIWALADWDIIDIDDVVCNDKDAVQLQVATDQDGFVKLNYLWQVDKGDGKGFVNAGSSKKTLALKATGAMNNYIYRCLVWNAANVKGCEAQSNEVSVSVKSQAQILKQAEIMDDYSVDSGILFKLPVVSGYNVKYALQISRKGGAWADVEMGIDVDDGICYYSFTEDDINCADLKFRFEVCSVDDDDQNIGVAKTTANISINTAVAPKIDRITLTQNGQTVVLSDESPTELTYGAPATLTAVATGSGLKYKWGGSAITSLGWTSLAGGTSAALKIPATFPAGLDPLNEDGSFAVADIYYDCNVVDKGKSSEYRYVKLQLAADTSLPTTLAGQGINSGLMQIVFSDAKNLKIIFGYGEYYSTGTYVYKRTSATTANLSISYSYKELEWDERTGAEKYVTYKVNLKGTMEGNSDNAMVNISLYNVNDDGESFEEEGLLSRGDIAPKTLEKGTLIYMNGDEFPSLWIKDSKTCVIGGYGQEAAYTYKKISNNVGVLSHKVLTPYDGTVTRELTIVFGSAGFVITKWSDEVSAFCSDIRIGSVNDTFYGVEVFGSSIKVGKNIYGNDGGGNIFMDEPAELRVFAYYAPEWAGVIKYQWMLDGGSGWQNIAGATGSTYKLPAYLRGDAKLQCKVTDSDGNERYVNFDLVLQDSPFVPKMAGLGFNIAIGDFWSEQDDFELPPDYECFSGMNIILLDASSCRISCHDSRYLFTSSTYSFKKIASNEALLTLKYTVKDLEEMKSYTRSVGVSLYIDSDGSYYASIENSKFYAYGIFEFLYGQDEFGGVNSYLSTVTAAANTDALIGKTANFEDIGMMKFINKTDVELIDMEVSAKYTYVKKSNNSGLLTIKYNEGKTVITYDIALSFDYSSSLGRMILTSKPSTGDGRNAFGMWELTE